MKSEDTISIRVVHAASAERVFDAWLDTHKAGTFLFATATGQIVRCDIDPRVGGGFTVVAEALGELPIGVWTSVCGTNLFG